MMSGAIPCPMLTVRPCRGLVDETFQIVVKNLPPGLKVTLHSVHQSEDNDFWEAFGHYVSDTKGTVSVAEDVSVGGSYQGTEPMGLLWSMKPVPGSRTGLRLQKVDVRTPMVVRISVYGGHVSQGFREMAVLAFADVERWYMVPGVHRVDIRESGVKGTLFIPPGPGPFPGILDLWGGSGGLVEYRSALLASHGFVSMVVEYLPLGESVPSDIGLSYFETAFRLVQQHPLVAPDRIALFGLSLGVSVSLSIAAYSKVAHPQCLVCVSGTHVLPVRDSLAEVMTQIAKNVHKSRYNEEKQVIWRDLILPIPSDPKKKIDVGQIKCPLALIVGGDDQNWPAPESAEDIEKVMKDAGNSHLLTTFSYPMAGHLFEPPFAPLCRTSIFIGEDKQEVHVLWGGETKAHAHAQQHSWRKILSFLEQHLHSSGDCTLLVAQLSAEPPRKATVTSVKTRL